MVHVRLVWVDFSDIGVQVRAGLRFGLYLGVMLCLQLITSLNPVIPLPYVHTREACPCPLASVNTGYLQVLL